MHSDEREIRQLVTTWMAASQAGDMDAVLSLMAEDVVFLLPGQAPMIGKAAFAAAAGAASNQGRPQFDGTSEIMDASNPCRHDGLTRRHCPLGRFHSRTSIQGRQPWPRKSSSTYR